MNVVETLSTSAAVPNMHLPHSDADFMTPLQLCGTNSVAQPFVVTIVMSLMCHPISCRMYFKIDIRPDMLLADNEIPDFSA
jgi:hypothetical protein